MKAETVDSTTGSGAEVRLNRCQSRKRKEATADAARELTREVFPLRAAGLFHFFKSGCVGKGPEKIVQKPGISSASVSGESRRFLFASARGAGGGNGGSSCVRVNLLCIEKRTLWVCSWLSLYLVTLELDHILVDVLLLPSCSPRATLRPRVEILPRTSSVTIPPATEHAIWRPSFQRGDDTGKQALST